MVEHTREQLLERYGRWYGHERFAVTFTASNEGEAAKRVTTKEWDRTRPLATADYAAGLIKERGQTRNVAIVLRPSNLVVLECDSEEDLVRIEQLELPRTITVRSSKPYKRHFYFRPPEHLSELTYVAFRFESGKLTADTGRYFLAPPSIHPTGAVYSFLPGLGPDEVDVAELPEDTYRLLATSARQESTEQRERITIDPNAKVRAGNRGDSLFRYASMLRRWGLSRDQILAAALDWNDQRCDPPIERQRVEMQVDGAMKKRGDQELERAHTHPIPDLDDDPGPEERPETPTVGNWKRLPLDDPQYLIPPDPPRVAQLLYAAKRHVLSGAPESAKTLIAYHLLLQALRDGDPVAIVDFEMGPTAARLMLNDLGATPQEIARIYYVEPDQPPADADIEALVEHGTRYCLIDAAAGAYDVSGLDDGKRAEVERWSRQWIRPLYRAGVATLVLDHVTKDKETRGKFSIGSERKLGGADVHLGFEALKAVSRGGNGMVKVTVHKDRPGFLARPTAAMLDLASSPDTHAITITIRDPHPVDDHGDFRPTIYMERVSRVLEKHAAPMTRNEIEDAVKGKREYVRDALDWLMRDGHSEEVDGPRRSRIVTLLKPYAKPPDDLAPPVSMRDHADVQGTADGPKTTSPRVTSVSTDGNAHSKPLSGDQTLPNDFAPTSPRPRPGEVPVTSPDLAPPRPPLTGGEGEDGGHGKAKGEHDLAPDQGRDPVDVYDPSVQSLLDDDIPF